MDSVDQSEELHVYIYVYFPTQHLETFQDIHEVIFKLCNAIEVISNKIVFFIFYKRISLLFMFYFCLTMTCPRLSHSENRLKTLTLTAFYRKVPYLSKNGKCCSISQFLKNVPFFPFCTKNGIDYDASILCRGADFTRQTVKDS